VTQSHYTNRNCRVKLIQHLTERRSYGALDLADSNAKWSEKEAKVERMDDRRMDETEGWMKQKDGTNQ
jgi:hypothetical protein